MADGDNEETPDKAADGGSRKNIKKLDIFCLSPGKALHEIGRRGILRQMKEVEDFHRENSSS